MIRIYFCLGSARPFVSTAFGLTMFDFNNTPSSSDKKYQVLYFQLTTFCKFIWQIFSGSCYYLRTDFALQYNCRLNKASTARSAALAIAYSGARLS
jgi:hypothetical protein